MDIFKTQFNLSGVPTDVTVKVTDEDTFACTLNLADFFDGGEREGIESEPDVTIKRFEDNWQIVGERKITMNDHDLESLGNAINQDYSRDV